MHEKERVSQINISNPRIINLNPKPISGTPVLCTAGECGCAGEGIEATETLAKSPNAQIIVIGNPKNGLPLIMGQE
ncbi:MAG: hypothetical protein WCG81_01655 [Candidatus Angelobacter sp.]